MSDEVWAEVDDFPDYIVSTHGKVMNRHTNKLLRPRDNSYGYSRVALRRDGKTHDVYIHHIVARAFFTGYFKGVRIKHQQDNSDNSLMNLRFMGRGIGQLRKSKRATARRVKIVETGQVFLTVESCAAYLGGDPSSIYRVLRTERDSYKGFTFEYQYEER